MWDVRSPFPGRPLRGNPQLPVTSPRNGSNKTLLSKLQNPWGKCFHVQNGIQFTTDNRVSNNHTL